MQLGAGRNIPNNDLLVGTTTNQNVLSTELCANDGLDEVGVTSILAARSPGVNIPGPNVLVPGTGKDGLVSGTTNSYTTDGCRGTAVDCSCVSLAIDLDSSDCSRGLGYENGRGGGTGVNNGPEDLGLEFDGVAIGVTSLGFSPLSLCDLRTTVC